MGDIAPIAEEFLKNIPDVYSNVQNLILNYNYTSLLETNLDKNGLVQAVTFGPVFPFFFICNIIYVSCNQRVVSENQPWTFNALNAFLGSVAGGTIARILVGKPPVWLISNALIPSSFIAWYLVHFSPFDIVYKLCLFLPIRIIVMTGATIMKARSIIDGVNLGLSELPKGSFVGTIFLGTISGFGGVLVGNLVTRVLGKEDWSEISRPTWASKSSFYSSIAFYFLIDPHHVFSDAPILPEMAARFAIIAYLVLNAFTVSVVGAFTPFPVNAIEYIFYSISRIPREEDVSHYKVKRLTKAELHEIDARERALAEEQRKQEQKEKKKKK